MRRNSRRDAPWQWRVFRVSLTVSMSILVGNGALYYLEEMLDFPYLILGVPTWNIPKRSTSRALDQTSPEPGVSVVYGTTAVPSGS